MSHFQNWSLIGVPVEVLFGSDESAEHHCKKRLLYRHLNRQNTSLVHPWTTLSRTWQGEEHFFLPQQKKATCGRPSTLGLSKVPFFSLRPPWPRFSSTTSLGLSNPSNPWTSPPHIERTSLLIRVGWSLLAFMASWPQNILDAWVHNVKARGYKLEYQILPPSISYCQT